MQRILHVQGARADSCICDSSDRDSDGDGRSCVIALAKPGELTFLATGTRTPYLAKYVGADANKVAHYPGAPGLRWVNTKGGKGLWSETASATIGA